MSVLQKNNSWIWKREKWEKVRKWDIKIGSFPRELHRFSIEKLKEEFSILEFRDFCKSRVRWELRTALSSSLSYCSAPPPPAAAVHIVVVENIFTSKKFTILQQPRPDRGPGLKVDIFVCRTGVVLRTWS
mmetsp:Transcript_23631/g.36326  ORF Transcript_23631/g.36326 Transcript_23631/m.36326 type:complete len:130 (-) Transcript_23631:487-876(-)